MVRPWEEWWYVRGRGDGTSVGGVVVRPWEGWWYIRRRSATMDLFFLDLQVTVMCWRRLTMGDTGIMCETVDGVGGLLEDTGTTNSLEKQSEKCVPHRDVPRGLTARVHVVRGEKSLTLLYLVYLYPSTASCSEEKERTVFHSCFLRKMLFCLKLFCYTRSSVLVSR